MRISNKIAWFGITVAFIIIGLGFAEAGYVFCHFKSFSPMVLWYLLMQVWASIVIFSFCKKASTALD